MLGCGVDAVDVDGALERIAAFVASGVGAQVVTFGAEMAVHAQRDHGYRDVINGADLVVADTVGVVWAARVLGSPLRERVAGIDLVERLIDVQRWPIYFLGGKDGVADRAAVALRERHPQLRVAGSHHGYFSEAESKAVADAICACGARVVLVALGFPRQEFWIRDHLPRLAPATCIGVGGAFDVWAGKSPRAPESWRRAGLEWLYRLVREPRRLRRQLALPEFAFRVFSQRLRIH